MCFRMNEKRSPLSESETAFSTILLFTQRIAAKWRTHDDLKTKALLDKSVIIKLRPAWCWWERRQTHLRWSTECCCEEKRKNGDLDCQRHEKRTESMNEKNNEICSRQDPDGNFVWKIRHDSRHTPKWMQIKLIWIGSVEQLFVLLFASESFRWN